MIDLIKTLPKGHFNKANLGRSSVIIRMEAKSSKEKLYCLDLWDKDEWAQHRTKPACPNDILGTFVNNIKSHGLKVERWLK